MNVLIITSGNSGKVHPFIEEQASCLEKAYDLNFDYFLIQKKGIVGYTKEAKRLRKLLKNKKYNLVHAHYGLSGLVSCLQLSTKKIVTYHGSDINYLPHRIMSQIAILLTNYSIFVSDRLTHKVIKKKYSVIPCGINLDYPIISKEEARKKLGWDTMDKKVLFSSSFSRSEKNPELAFSVIKTLNKDFPGIELIELSGYTREEVNLLMSACDLLLLTSHREGSPQVIKEALYFKLPIVATNVGVIKEILEGVDHTYVCAPSKSDLTEAVTDLIKKEGRIKNNSIAEEFDNSKIAEKIYNIYLKVLDR